MFPKKLKIELIGCDATTDVEINVISQEELELLKQVEAKSIEGSIFGCYPVLYIKEIDGEKQPDWERPKRK